MKSNFDSSVLIKVARQPGLCSEEEILYAKNYYEQLDSMLNIFKYVYNYDPVGQTVSSMLNNLEFYVNRFNKSKCQ